MATAANKANAPVQEAITAEETVRITIPLTAHNTEDVFVSINERTWQIKRGVPVEVPICVAKTIERSEDMEIATAERIRKLSK